MRIVGLMALLLVLAGCASERSVTFFYYPNHPGGGDFPKTYQFAAEAQKECGRYGLYAVHEWDSVSEFQRVRSAWRCVERPPAY